MQARQGKHSRQQCKRYRANTVTANSKASATRQAAQQPQPAPLTHRCNSRPRHLSTNKAELRFDIYFPINAQNAVIAVCMPGGAVECRLGTGGEGQRRGEQQYASTAFTLCSPAPARPCTTTVVVLGLLRPDFTGHRTAAVVVRSLREHTSVYVVAVVQLEPDPCRHLDQSRWRKRQPPWRRERYPQSHQGRRKRSGCRLWRPQEHEREGGAVGVSVVDASAIVVSPAAGGAGAEKWSAESSVVSGEEEATKVVAAAVAVVEGSAVVRGGVAEK